jgi:hypothetical protein
MNAFEKAWDTAIESSKLLITLSTGIIAFSVAFFDKDTMMRPESLLEKLILLFSWLLLLASAGFGLLWTQMGMISTLNPSNKVDDNYKPDLRHPRITTPYNWQICLFVAGIFLIITFGGIKVFNNKMQEQEVKSERTTATTIVH